MTKQASARQQPTHLTRAREEANFIQPSIDLLVHRQPLQHQSQALTTSPDTVKLLLNYALMPDHPSSSSCRSASRKDSTTTARHHPSKLKSWFTNLYSLASPSSSPSHPHAQIHSQLLSTLPLEIRHQIYVQVLYSYGSVQHIRLSNNKVNKMTHMRCASPCFT